MASENFLNISDLSTELLCNIMKYLSLREVLAVGMLCKKLSIAVNMHLHLCKSIDFCEDSIYGYMPSSITDDHMHALFRKCPELQTVYGLHPLRVERRRLRKRSALTVPGIIEALSLCANLKAIETCDLRLLEAVMQHLPQLEIIGHFQNRDGVFPPHASQRLKLQPYPRISSLHLIGVEVPELTAMPHLQHLHLQCVRFTKLQPFRAFLAQNLKSFVMKHCMGPPIALRYLSLIIALSSSPNLAHLELVRVPLPGGLFQRAVEDSYKHSGFVNLKTLIISGCKGVLEVDLGHLMIVSSKNLETLHIQPSLTKDSLFVSLSFAQCTFPKLHNLHLGYMDKLNAPGDWSNDALLTLGLAEVPDTPSSLTDSGMKVISQLFPAVRCMSVSNCPHLMYLYHWMPGGGGAEGWTALSDLTLQRCHCLQLLSLVQFLQALPKLQVVVLNDMFREPPKGCSHVGLSAGTGLGMSSAVVSNQDEHIAVQGHHQDFEHPGEEENDENDYIDVEDDVEPHFLVLERDFFDGENDLERNAEVIEDLNESDSNLDASKDVEGNSAIKNVQNNKTDSQLNATKYQLRQTPKRMLRCKKESEENGNAPTSFETKSVESSQYLTLGKMSQYDPHQPSTSKAGKNLELDLNVELKPNINSSAVNTLCEQSDQKAAANVNECKSDNCGLIQNENKKLAVSKSNTDSSAKQESTASMSINGSQRTENCPKSTFSSVSMHKEAFPASIAVTNRDNEIELKTSGRSLRYKRKSNEHSLVKPKRINMPHTVKSENNDKFRSCTELNSNAGSSRSLMVDSKVVNVVNNKKSQERVKPSIESEKDDVITIEEIKNCSNVHSENNVEICKKNISSHNSTYNSVADHNNISSIKSTEGITKWENVKSNHLSDTTNIVGPVDFREEENFSSGEVKYSDSLSKQFSQSNENMQEIKYDSLPLKISPEDSNCNVQNELNGILNRTGMFCKYCKIKLSTNSLCCSLCAPSTSSPSKSGEKSAGEASRGNRFVENQEDVIFEKCIGSEVETESDLCGIDSANCKSINSRKSEKSKTKISPGCDIIESSNCLQHSSAQNGIISGNYVNGNINVTHKRRERKMSPSSGAKYYKRSKNSGICTSVRNYATGEPREESFSGPLTRGRKKILNKRKVSVNTSGKKLKQSSKLFSNNVEDSSYSEVLKSTTNNEDLTCDEAISKRDVKHMETSKIPVPENDLKSCPVSKSKSVNDKASVKSSGNSKQNKLCTSHRPVTRNLQRRMSIRMVSQGTQATTADIRRSIRRLRAASARARHPVTSLNVRRAKPVSGSVLSHEKSTNPEPRPESQDKATSTSDPLLEEDAIQILQLTSETLLSFTVVNCGISNLVIQRCPMLFHIEIQACRILKKIQLNSCPSLRRLNVSQCPKLNICALVPSLLTTPLHSSCLVSYEPCMQAYHPGHGEKAVLFKASRKQSVVLCHDFIEHSNEHIQANIKEKLLGWLDYFSRLHSQLKFTRLKSKGKMIKSEEAVMTNYPWCHDVRRLHGQYVYSGCPLQGRYNILTNNPIVCEALATCILDKEFPSVSECDSFNEMSLFTYEALEKYCQMRKKFIAFYIPITENN